MVFALLWACGGERPRSTNDDDDWSQPTTTGPTTTGSEAATTGGPGGSGSGGSGGSSSAASGGSGGASMVLPGDLVITEIMNNPAAVLDADGEWFEIHNTTNQPIDLNGILIRHQPGSSTPVPIDASVMVPANGFVVLGCNGDPATNGNVTVDYVYGFEVSLHNALDYLAIERSDAVVIDETSWDEASGLDPDGESRNLDPQFMSAAMNDDDTNYCMASSPIGGSTDLGTPGAPNDDCP
jgi:hypothetical protein